MQGFTIFIPVLNEERLLEANALTLLKHCQGLGREFELIIGSNGSTDATTDIGRGLEVDHPEVRFFHLEQPGPGRAFEAAVVQATQPYLITLDMDLSVGPSFIDEALALLDGGAQVVVGSKQAGRQERGAVRIVCSGAFILAARALLGMSFRDYSLGAKAFVMDMVRRYAHDIDHNTGYILAMIYRAQQEGASIVELPVSCRDLRAGRFSLWREGL